MALPCRTESLALAPRKALTSLSAPGRPARLCGTHVLTVHVLGVCWCVYPGGHAGNTHGHGISGVFIPLPHVFLCILNITPVCGLNK